jgi:WD40 repeat protein
LNDSIENPYVGPRTFEEKDSRFFFGREREARELLSLVISEPLVLFYAQSGAGKSSLINTRLGPGLRQEGFEVLPIGRVSGELPAGITKVDNIFIFNLLLNLDQSQAAPQQLTHTTLTGYLQAHRPETTTRDDDHQEPARVLIIDQFEEIVTSHLDRWTEREGFFQQLRQAINADPLLWVVLTLREDYVAALDPYARLLPGKLRARFYMQRMGYQAAQQAIEKPARQAGRPFAPGVAETLVDNLRQIRVQAETATQLGQFVEPVQLQVVCYQLWENLKKKSPGEITAQDLQEAGDVDTALAQFYERAIATVLRETGGSEIELRNWFEHQLITETGTRGTVYQGKEQTGGLDNRTVQLLANQFLLRAEIRAGGDWYELVHDRFIEPILQANRTWWQQQSPLIQAAQTWADSGKDKSKLYLGQQLKDAQASLGQSEPEPLVAEFLAASEAENQVLEERAKTQARINKILRWGATIIGVIGLIAVIAAILAFQQAQQAQIAQSTAVSAEEKAVANAELAATRAVEAETNAALATTREAEAMAAQKTAEERRLEAEAARDESERSALIARAGQLAAQAQTTIIENYPQLSLLLAVEAVGTTAQVDDLRVSFAEDVLVQTLTNAGGHSLGNYDDTVAATAISPDNQWLVTAGGNTARLWDLTGLNTEPILLPLQKDPVAEMAFSPDSQWLAIAGGAIVHLWNLADPISSQDPLILRSHEDDIEAMVFSPDSRWLVTGSADNTTRVWDLTDLTTAPLILPVQQSAITAIAISPDNRWLVTTGSFDTMARVWDLSDLAASPIILTIPPSEKPSLAITPNSQQLVIGSEDTYVWDLTNLNPAAAPTVLPSQSLVNAIAVSPDNHWLVTGNQDSTVQVWNLTNLDSQPASLHSPNGAITSLAISSDSHWLAGGSADHGVYLWNITKLDAEPLVLRGHDDVITTLAISPDNHWLATGSADRSARLWDLTAPRPASAAPIVLPSHQDAPITKVAIHPDDQWLVTANAEAMLQLWDLTTANGSTSERPAPVPAIETGHQGTITAMVISPDGRWLATSSDDGTARVWNWPSLSDSTTTPAILSGHKAAVTTMAISLDSHWLATGSDDATVRLWDLTNLDAEPIILRGHKGSVTAVAISSDGRWLATGSGDTTARLWDLRNVPGAVDEPIVLSGHQDWIGTIAFSPDNHWLATGDDSGVVKLWDLQNTTDLSTLEPIDLDGHTTRITAITVSPNNRWLVTASADTTARLWDLTNLDSEPIILRGHERSILALAISPDSRWLVTSSFDSTARLWNLQSADPAATAVVLRGHNGGISAVAISPDNHWLVTGSADASAHLWTLRLNELVDLACGTAGRGFTEAEWLQYFPGELYRETCSDQP